MWDLERLREWAKPALAHPELVTIARYAQSARQAKNQALAFTKEKKLGEEVAKACRWLMIIGRDYGRDVLERHIEKGEETKMNEQRKELEEMSIEGLDTFIKREWREGNATDVQNPRRSINENRYDWSTSQLQDALRKGEIHAFLLPRGLLVDEPGYYLYALRFKDVSLGRRIAKTILERALRGDYEVKAYKNRIRELEGKTGKGFQDISDGEIHPWHAGPGGGCFDGYGNSIPCLP